VPVDRGRRLGQRAQGHAERVQGLGLQAAIGGLATDRQCPLQEPERHVGLSGPGVRGTDRPQRAALAAAVGAALAVRQCLRQLGQRLLEPAEPAGHSTQVAQRVAL
jgi:hypothetical protein